MSVVLDDAVSTVDDRPDLAGWTAVLARQPRLLVLTASLPTLLARNAARSTPLPDDMVRAVHHDMAPWSNRPHVDTCDTTGRTIEQTAAIVLAHWSGGSAETSAGHRPSS